MITTTKEIQRSRVHEYVMDNDTINLTDMMTSLRADGVPITRPVALKALREEGLEPYSTTLNGARIRLWRKIDETKAPSTNAGDANENDADETDGASDAPKQNKIESNIARLQDETEKLSSEKANLFDLVQKSVDLKKQIRTQQATLLREMASLINELYGDSDV